MVRSVWLSASIVAALCGSRTGVAQNPCWDHELKGDSQYPEVDSKCVRSKYSSDRAEFSAEVPGPQFRPASGDNDHTCVDAPATSTCRTLCGDLAPNEQPGGLGQQGIVPPDYALFEQHLMVFNKGNHYRVCLRLKNWAFTSLLGSGTPKRFIFTVLYSRNSASATSASTSAGSGTSNTHKVLQGESLAKIAEQTYGKQSWAKIYNANRDKISNPNLIFPDQVLTIPK